MRDVLVEFQSPQAAPASMVGAAGVNIQIGSVIDLLGVGQGQAPPNIIGNASLFGQDPGIGIWVPEVEITVGTAFTTGNAATANIAFQYAPDTGAAGGYLPGAWETAAETGAKPVSEMTANQVLRMKVPPTPPNTPTPRFARLLFQVPAATNMTAGTITWAGIIQGRDDLQNKNAANNYVVA
jgi:hypothetical protein